MGALGVGKGQGRGYPFHRHNDGGEGFWEAWEAIARSDTADLQTCSSMPKCYSLLLLHVSLCSMSCAGCLLQDSPQPLKALNLTLQCNIKGFRRGLVNAT